MGNTYFQFKQFRINQEGSAMKVCTDSCIFGAWIDATGSNHILDVGTGTGLLALMIAQKSKAKIDAVELDKMAYHQALQNFQASPWDRRLSLVHSDIRDFYLTPPWQYDIIICNPPFYANYLKSPDNRRNQVLHSTTFSINDLLAVTKRLLIPEGKLFVMLPPKQADSMDELAGNIGLYPIKKLRVKERQNKDFIRIITSFSFYYKETELEDLIIREPDNQYSEAFTLLLKDYYLNL